MQDQQFDFIPYGDPPTVKNTWKYYWKGVGVLLVIMLIVFIVINSRMYINLLLLFFALVVLLTSVTISNHFTKKVCIDTINRKFYKYYITAFGREGVIILDLNTSKITYKLNLSRPAVYWTLKLKDKNSSVEFRETRNPLSKTQKNVFTKAQLDKINEIVISCTKLQ